MSLWYTMMNVIGSVKLFMDKNFEIHICHHSDNNNRYNYLKNKFTGYDFYFETSFHPTQIEKHGIATYLGDNEWWNLLSKKLIKDFHLVNLFHVPNDFISKLESIFNLIFNRNTFERLSSIGQLSLILKHDQSIRNFLQSNYSYALIIEDDAIISVNALDRLNLLLGEVKDLPFSNSPLFLDVGEGASMSLSSLIFMNKRILRNVYKMKIKACRTTCAYVINRPFANKWVSEFNNSTFPSDFIGSDFLMSGFLSYFDINVLWAYPSYISHGSENGSWISNFN